MEIGRGNDMVGVGVGAPVVEKANWHPHWKLDKYMGDFNSESEIVKAGIKPYETVEFDGNCLLNEGINAAMWPLICGTGGTAFSEANSYLGVGDSSTGAAATQTGLQAAVNKYYQAVDTGYPTVGTNQQAVWKATIAGANANFAWNEVTVANGNSDASTNLNRVVQALGTKAEGTTWVLTLTVTLS